MATARPSPAHSTGSTTVADLLERVLDKGVVIAGDIKVSLVDIELLSIQIRLVVCSVDKAREMGMDWWVNHPVFSAQKPPTLQAQPEAAQQALERVEDRLARLEQALQERSIASALATDAPPPSAPPPPQVPAWVTQRPSP